MPYYTKKVGSKTCVYKKSDGSKVGCTSGSIKKYLSALHMNEEINMKKAKTLKGMVNRIIREELHTSSPENDVFVIYFDRTGSSKPDALKFKQNSPYSSTSVPRDSHYGVRVTVDKNDVADKKKFYELVKLYHGSIYE